MEQIGLLVVLLVDFAGAYDWARCNGAPILWLLLVLIILGDVI